MSSLMASKMWILILYEYLCNPFRQVIVNDISYFCLEWMGQDDWSWFRSLQNSRIAVQSLFNPGNYVKQFISEFTLGEISATWKWCVHFKQTVPGVDKFFTDIGAVKGIPQMVIISYIIKGSEPGIFVNYNMSPTCSIM